MVGGETDLLDLCPAGLKLDVKLSPRSNLLRPRVQYNEEARVEVNIYSLGRWVDLSRKTFQLASLCLVG